MRVGEMSSFRSFRWDVFRFRMMPSLGLSYRSHETLLGPKGKAMQCNAPYYYFLLGSSSEISSSMCPAEEGLDSTSYRIGQKSRVPFRSGHRVCLSVTYFSVEHRVSLVSGFATATGTTLIGRVTEIITVPAAVFLLVVVLFFLLGFVIWHDHGFHRNFSHD